MRGGSCALRLLLSGLSLASCILRFVFCFMWLCFVVVFCGLRFPRCCFFFVCSDSSARATFIAPPNKRDTGAPCSHLILTPAVSAFQRGKTNPLVHCYSHNVFFLRKSRRKILFLLFFLLRAVCAALLLAVARGVHALAVARNK